MRFTREFFWLLALGVVSAGLGMAWFIDRTLLELRLERSHRIQGESTRRFTELAVENKSLREEVQKLKLAGELGAP